MTAPKVDQVVRVPLNLSDEYLALFEAPDEPLSVHVEVRIGGRLDEERLGGAIRAALQRHPLARARLVERDRRLYWLVDSRPGCEALSSCRAETQSQIDANRSLFLSEHVPLNTSPPVRVRLVRATDGDHLMLNVNHAVCDGLGALRLTQSIARAYGGVPDPLFAGDAMREWRFQQTETPAHVSPTRAVIVGIERLLEALSPVGRLAPDGGTTRPGYGIRTRPVELMPIISSRIRHALDASVNDVLLAALHRAMGRWNRSHGVGSDRLSVIVPINVRGAHQEPALVGNFVVTDTVSTWAADRASAEATLRGVCRQTRRFKETGSTFAALMAFGAGWPSWVDRHMPWLFRGLRANGPGGGAMLSNLGRGDRAVEGFGADLPVTGLWFSPPAAFPIGVSLGVVSHGGFVYLALRYRWPRLDDLAALHLLDLIVGAITEFY